MFGRLPAAPAACDKLSQKVLRRLQRLFELVVELSTRSGLRQCPDTYSFLTFTLEPLVQPS
jgi:hypothetical protein